MPPHCNRVFALFERSNKGVILTDEGEKLYENVSVAVEHIVAAEERILASKKIDGGFVSIGVTEIALRCFLLPVLDQYREKYKGVRIKIVNISTPQALVMQPNLPNFFCVFSVCLIKAESPLYM